MRSTTTFQGRRLDGNAGPATGKLARRLAHSFGAAKAMAHRRAHAASTVLSNLMCVGLLVGAGASALSMVRHAPANSSPSRLASLPEATATGVTTRRVVTERIDRDGNTQISVRHFERVNGEAAARAAANDVRRQVGQVSGNPVQAAASGAPGESSVSQANSKGPTDPAPTITPTAGPDAWPTEEIEAATAVCKEALRMSTAQAELIAPIRAGQCGDPAPIKMSSAGSPGVTFSPPVTINCKTAVAVDTWVKTVLQPAAKELLGSRVVSLSSTSSYVCRNRKGAADGPISEHAFANAFDVGAFKLADGRVIEVGTWGALVKARPATPSGAATTNPPSEPGAERDTKKAAAKHAGVDDTLRSAGQLIGGGRPAMAGAPVKSTAAPTPPVAADPGVAFLRRIHDNACGLFGTVLGPEANEAHREHLHFDMKVRRGGKAFCE